MARKEQDRGRQESKSRVAARASARSGQPAAAPQASNTPAPSVRGKAKGRAGTAIAACGCASEFQDGRYGKGMRVFNLGASGGKCAVCGAKRSV